MRSLRSAASSSVLFAALLCGVGTLTLRAQSVASGGAAKIASIDGTGSAKYSSDKIAAASGLKPGDSVTKDDLQGAANRLAQIGLFTGVNFHYDTKPDGVHLHLEVQDAPTAPVQYDNFPWFTNDDLNAGVRASFPFFDGTVPQQGSMLDEIGTAIQKMLPSKGAHGSVQHALLHRPDDSGMFMQFSLIGGSVNLQAVQFGDSLATASPELKVRLADVVEHPYSRLAIEMFAFEQARPIYLAAGHLKVAFGEPQAMLGPAAGTVAPIGVTATLPITPGPQYHWGGVTWVGNNALSTTGLNSTVKLAPNAIADGNQIQALWLTVAVEYSRIGYLDARVEPVPQFDDAAGKVSYRVTVTEGPQFHMGQLIVTGLSLEAEKKLRAAWTLQPGSVFDEIYFESFRDGLAHPTSNVFGSLPVHYEKMGDLARRDDEKKTVDVLLDFQ
jgi:outer membrane protein assembly factor BamA